MAQQVKDAMLSLLQLRSLLWCGFDPWPRNFHMLLAWPKRKKKVIISDNMIVQLKNTREIIRTSKSMQGNCCI